MKTAIFGFSSAGKTDMFAALAGEKAALAGNRAMVKVPEPRLDPLIALFKPKKITLSEIEYLDVPGGGGKGHGLGERVLTDIRPYDCLLCVLDAFSGLADPKQQYGAVEADLLVSDLAVVEKRQERMASDKRKNKELVDAKEEDCLAKARAILEQDKPLRVDPDLCFEPCMRGFRFLSAKPILYTWNIAEKDMGAFELPADGLGQMHMAVSARLERELAAIEDPEERAMFLTDLGLSESALDMVISRTYTLLGLMSFLTAGDKEVRSWPVRVGATAPEAAGVIHTDFQKGFIRAEVIGYADFLKAGDFKKAKELGLARLEGKDYYVHDGDIIEFRFNV
ncbi:MAG: redox-regulated ATPase YchF [Desulfovibrio sp.]|nr:redox-regulated ATPase YchF [Desulfovibrio sp.]